MEILESSKICTCNKKFNTNVKSQLNRGKTIYLCILCDKFDEEVTEFHNNFDHLKPRQFKSVQPLSIHVVGK